MKLNIKTFGSGYPLVLLHGWGFDHQVWQSLTPFLEETFQIFYVDLPGFGLSSMMDLDQFHALLIEQLPAKFALLGWSLGGLFATQFAMKYPSVTHLINVCSSPCFIKKEGWPGIKKTNLEIFYDTLEADPQKAVLEFQALQNPGNLSYTSELNNKGLANGLHMLQTWDLRIPLKELTIPTCYSFGRLDAIVPLATYSSMQKMYPQFHYVLFKSAHMPFLSEQTAFLQMLEDFIL